MSFKWYIVHVYSGFEQKVASEIVENAKRANLAEYIKEVYVPKEKKTQTIRNKRVVMEKNAFPGYVFVCADLIDNLFSIVKNTPRVTNFLSTASGKPKVILEKEIEVIKKQSEESLSKPIKDTFEIGEIVKINKDPFTDFNGTIKSIEENGSMLKVEVSIFGKPLMVDVEFENVKRVEDEL